MSSAFPGFDAPFGLTSLLGQSVNLSQPTAQDPPAFTGDSPTAPVARLASWWSDFWNGGWSQVFGLGGAEDTAPADSNSAPKGSVGGMPSELGDAAAGVAIFLVLAGVAYFLKRG